MTKRSENSIFAQQMRRQQAAQGPANSPQAHAHKMVAETAKQMAGALYEKVMKSNVAYSEWLELNSDITDARELELRFIKLMIPKLLGEARANLASLLRTPISAELKDSIHEALVLDNTLRRGRVGVPTLAQR